MILVRSPLRITLGGGGTDLPAYANEHGGFCLTAAITQYVYVSVMRPFEPGIYLKYSEIERANTAADVKHPIIREALQMLNVPSQVEITTLADIPSGTGLGSSSSFTTALLRALAVYQHDGHDSAKDLAAMACELEIERLKAPIRPQDQYAAAYGGLMMLTINPDGSVCHERMALSTERRQALEDRLLLYFTGYTRETNAILQTQSTEGLDAIKEYGRLACFALHNGNWQRFGELLHDHWRNKQRRSRAISNDCITEWYDLAKQHGAIGGKLVGAGGGGCLLFCTNDPQKLRAGLKDSGLHEIRFRFDTEGTKVLTT